MSDQREDQERPCLHCLIVELIDDFFAEYPATAGSDKVDTDEADEVIDAIAKTVAELTSQQDGVRKIVHYDEFRTEEVTSAAGCGAGGSATIGVRVEFYPHPKPARPGGRSAVQGTPSKIPKTPK